MTDQVPPPDPTAAAMRLRASDADRERVADVLREAYVDVDECAGPGDYRRALRYEKLAE